MPSTRGQPTCPCRATPYDSSIIVRLGPRLGGWCRAPACSVLDPCLEHRRRLLWGTHATRGTAGTGRALTAGGAARTGNGRSGTTGAIRPTPHAPAAGWMTRTARQPGRVSVQCLARPSSRASGQCGHAAPVSATGSTLQTTRTSVGAHWRCIPMLAGIPITAPALACIGRVPHATVAGTGGRDRPPGCVPSDHRSHGNGRTNGVPGHRRRNPRRPATASAHPHRVASPSNWRIAPHTCACTSPVTAAA